MILIPGISPWSTFEREKTSSWASCLEETATHWWVMSSSDIQTRLGSSSYLVPSTDGFVLEENTLLQVSLNTDHDWHCNDTNLKSGKGSRVDWRITKDIEDCEGREREPNEGAREREAALARDKID